MRAIVGTAQDVRAVGAMVDRALGLPNENAERWAEPHPHPMRNGKWAYPVDERIVATLIALREVFRIPDEVELTEEWSPPSHPVYAEWLVQWVAKYGAPPPAEVVAARFPDVDAGADPEVP